ncbi:sphingosine kinase 1 [Anastrepha obliqua]|uniref:sphingosine kinase 1 n=1 Tax=Anastrepha obliqua TaxID=95512 RepID=UPI00240A6CE3|nr:sphingosine kinase 1 [Anastrepha obliqua]XP_054727405.1 sphingosine kinase 1 [Anastrepha obliqua]
MQKQKVSCNLCSSFIMDPCQNLPLASPDISQVYDDTAAGDVGRSITPTSSVAKISLSGLIELSEHFYINNSKQKDPIKVEVILNCDGIFLRRETGEQNEISEQRICMEDIIGSSCGPRLKKSHRGSLASCRRINEDSEVENATQKDTSAYLHMYAYIKNEKGAMRRERTVRILRFRSFETYEENLKVAERWHHAIRINQAAAKNRLGEKQILIFLNPKSGKGKGREMFHKQVAPVLKEADMPYELHVTAHSNYAREFVRKHNDLLRCYSAILIASGDGLFYEVLNGIMVREDWRAITRALPLGIIPCGSGNGLARSIAYLYNEPYEPKPILYATLTCVRGQIAPMDIVRIDTGKEGKSSELYSFLSVGWGFIADIDIESEPLRSIGATRFTFWSIRRLIGLRTYTGKLSYLRCDKKGRRRTVGNLVATASHEERPLPPEVQEFHDIPNLPEGAKEDDFQPVANTDEADEEFGEAISLDHVSTHSYADSWHSATSQRTAYFSLPDQSLRSRRSVLSRLETINLEYESRRPPSTIPALDQPVPTDTWHTEEGEYVMVHAAYTTHISSDCFFAPSSRLNDGIIYLVIIRAGVGRSQLAHFLMGLSSGTHLPEQPNRYIEIVPVRAFRIEPNSDKEGIITVDGERVDYGPIQGEIMSGIINVMVPNANPID